MKAYLYLEWTDSRLHLPEGFLGDHFILPPNNADKIWTPDIFISESEDSDRLSMLHEDIRIWIYEGGRITYMTKFKFKIGCPMYFQYYPLDEQHCYITLMSCK